MDAYVLLMDLNTRLILTVTRPCSPGATYTLIGKHTQVPIHQQCPCTPSVPHTG